MKNKGLLIIIVASIAAVLTGLWLTRSGKPESSVPPSSTIKSSKETKPNQEPQTKAPDFSLKDYEGNVVSLADFSGKNLVINSWAVWCPFCVQELKDFATVQEEFGDQVTIIAIDRAEPIKTVKEFTDELELTDKLLFLLDPSDSFYANISGFTMPETIFVDSEGYIVDHKRGPMDKNEIRKRTSQLLNPNL
jgi:peroxiredoxin